MNLKKTYDRVTSGASFGAIANDEHARLAVQSAIKEAPDGQIGGVLLFLTSGYALQPQNAIKEAAKASGTLNITGCCALSVFTESADSTDREGAVALAFPHEMALSPLETAQQRGQEHELCLNLSSPNAGASSVQSTSIPQFGAIASDEFGEGPYSLWQGGRIVEREFSHNAFATDSQYYLAQCESVRPISELMQINRSDKHGLIEIDQRSALDSLSELTSVGSNYTDKNSALTIMAAVSETTDPKSIDSGHYKLLHVVSVNKADKRLMLSETVKAGHRMYWAIRDPRYAEQQMRKRLLNAKRDFSDQPKYALMFSNINRGSAFYQGQNRDLQLFKEIFPQTPMIGIASQAEITPGYRANARIQHGSTVFGLFK